MPSHSRVLRAAFAPLATLALAFVTGIACADSVAPTFVFRSIGPATSGGRVTAVAGTDRDAALYYIGAAGGGIYKTTNGGFDWTPVFDEAAVAPIGALAIAPSNPNIVWAGTGEDNPRNDVSYGDGVYRTNDAGKTWQHLGLSETSQISSISLDPRDPQLVLVGALGDPFADSTERGVYRTGDGGRTWTRTLFLGPSSGVSDMVRDPHHPEIVYAGMWQVRRRAWSIASGGPADGLYRSTNGGASWSRLSGKGLPRGIMGRIGLAIAPSDSHRIYALIQSSEGLLWRSDDAGRTWRMTSANTLINQRPFYFSRVFVDPTNKDHVFCSSVHLVESHDGGKTWKQTGRRLHGDHHAMFIAADGKRILGGGDGGAELSLDGGATWVRMNYAVLGQAYHVGFDLQTPYRVCAAEQDDGTFCGPSVGTAADGIVSRDWLKVSGGDGTHAWPDPLDPALIWHSSGGEDNGGSLGLYDTRRLSDENISPYLRDQNVVAPKDLAYRFNWEAPVAFSPQDGHVAYYGGNVVFETRDRGRSWRVISPDLTRNVAAHQLITGGPITREGTGAETSDTILTIAPSAARAGQLWIGTDDGVVQVTSDGGTTWRNVTMPGIDDAARVTSIDLSASDPATAYVSVERHFVGDRTPYVYVTHDGGARWRRIDAGLPRNQFVRCVRLDPRNPSLLYAGLEQSLWFSLDGGGSWERLIAGLPPASVRDIHVHPRANDLIVATHGRGVWILDDVAALQELARARKARHYLFAPRPAIAYAHHDDTFDVLGGGSNPAGDALMTFYRASGGSGAAQLEILDTRGRIVRHLRAPNATGVVRVAWDRTEDPPVAWHSAPEWNRGPEGGAEVIPGTYTVRLVVDGVRLQRPLRVLPDSRAVWSMEDYARRHDFLASLYMMESDVDIALNRLDAARAQLRERKRRPALKAETRQTLLSALARADAIAATLSANLQNDQDNDFLTDVLRERIQALIGAVDGSSAPPTAAQLREYEAIAHEFHARMNDVATYTSDDLVRLNRALRESG
ncbi:MAG: hypothetical protein JO043_00145, partial [Candidatus Eremiobacteraeota bacterium]|nr:hypothetical protein [Candidatus Eremiobacteraeota bacterium]